MKVNPARFSAIWCAASDTGSIRPASADAAANTPTSSVSCIAAGSPRTTSLPNPWQLEPPRDAAIRERRLALAHDDDHQQRAAMATRDSTVAQAAPATPSAGAPRRP